MALSKRKKKQITIGVVVTAVTAAVVGGVVWIRRRGRRPELDPGFDQEGGGFPEPQPEPEPDPFPQVPDTITVGATSGVALAKRALCRDPMNLSALQQRALINGFFIPRWRDYLEANGTPQVSEQTAIGADFTEALIAPLLPCDDLPSTLQVGRALAAQALDNILSN